MKASAHARWPKCGLGPALSKPDQHTYITQGSRYVTNLICEHTFTIPNINLRMCTELFQYEIRHLQKIVTEIKCKHFVKKIWTAKGRINPTFCGVLLENEILTLPHVFRTLCSEFTSCLARSTSYLQFPNHWKDYALKIPKDLYEAEKNQLNM